MTDIQLFLGDCLDVMAGLPDSSADAVITSPPYWNQRAYAYWPTYALYLESVCAWVQQVARLLKPGRYCFWVIPDKLPYPPGENGSNERLYLPVYADTEQIAARSGLVCEFPIIWKKPHGTQKMFGSYPYPPTIIHTPMTERICIWRKPGQAVPAATKADSQFSKRQWVDWAQDYWEISPETGVDHPAPFPIDIPRRILTLWTFLGDTVLDPFMGSGTTGIACARMGRSFVGIELDEGYFKASRRRIQKERMGALPVRSRKGWR